MDPSISRDDGFNLMFLFGRLTGLPSQPASISEPHVSYPVPAST